MSYAISTQGFALVQEHEGFHFRPTPLPAGGWVVGHGHVRTGAPGKRVTRKDAAVLLSQDLASVASAVNEKVKQPLTQAQFDALVSFAFSIGVDAFARSQVLRRVNAGEFVLAACSMEAWRKSDASGAVEVSGALVRRRAAEKSLFLRDLAQSAMPSAMLRAKIDRAAMTPAAPTPERKPDPARRVTEILLAEPATRVVLLSTPQTPEQAAEGEIVTAHAKPVARETQRRAAATALKDSKFALSPQTDGFGLIVLLGLGLALISLGASILFDGAGQLIEVVAAIALAAPGVAIALTAAFALRRAPHGESHA